MAVLFGVDFPKVIADAMGAGLLPATLVKVDSAAYNPADPTAAPTQVVTSIPCRGFVEDFTDREVDGTVVLRSDRKIMLLAATIKGGAVPKPMDKITIEGATYQIRPDGVKADPATATYTCHCRR